MMLRWLLLAGVIGLSQQVGFAQATPATQPEAAGLYLRAGKMVEDWAKKGVMSPSSSNLVYAWYPPFPADWWRMEKGDFPANAPAREWAHQARAMATANWPRLVPPKPDVSWLSLCRALDDEMGDAALYEHLQGDDAAAIETVCDLTHLSDLLENHGDTRLLNLMVGIGIRALDLHRLEVITAAVVLTRDAGDKKDLQVATARELIAELLRYQNPQNELNECLAFEGAKLALTGHQLDSVLLTLKRVDMERGLVAMSLACHVYRFEHGRWPASLEELRGEMPEIPVDLLGDGMQTLGYVLVTGGLPGGGDRPLVYSRCRSKDGLFFRTDEPLYGFTVGDGSTRPMAERKEGGQFRDVTAWMPPARKHAGATTRGLE